METDPENTLIKNNDLAEGTFLVKWPHWIRWLLFLPASVIVPALYMLFQIIATNWFLDIGPNAFYLVIMRGIAYGGGFVFVGSLVAPKYQKVVSILLLIIMSIITGIGILSSIIVGPTFASIAESIIMLAAGGYATYFIFQEGQ